MLQPVDMLATLLIALVYRLVKAPISHSISLYLFLYHSLHSLDNLN